MCRTLYARMSELLAQGIRKGGTGMAPIRVLAPLDDELPLRCGGNRPPLPLEYDWLEPVEPPTSTGLRPGCAGGGVARFLGAQVDHLILAVVAMAVLAAAAGVALYRFYAGHN